MSTKTRVVLAIGGGSFLMEEGLSAIDRYLLNLSAKEKPRVCFVPTPSGDLPEHLDKFHAAYSTALCVPTHLSFFRKQSKHSVPLDNLEAHLLAQDIIYVGGGNTKSALAVWHEWGVDVVFKKALEGGVVLSGMSAGAMCWFQQGLTDSFWGPELRPLQCLGFVSGGCGVHYSADRTRRETLHKALQAKTIEPSIAIDDNAAVLYRNGELDSVLSWREGATAYQVSLKDGKADEVALQARSIRLGH